jgi:quercetin dioxygenase-like cupin family protein
MEARNRRHFKDSGCRGTLGALAARHPAVGKSERINPPEGETRMHRTTLKTIGAAALATAAIATLGLGAPAALAGECPADKVVAGAMKADGHTASKDATDTVLAMTRLADHYPEINGRDFRLRYLTVAPGGEVAWHSHADRPAMIYITEGSITEYRSDCALPIEHKAGDVAAEAGTLEHWWRNNDTATATLISVDLPRSE